MQVSGEKEIKAVDDKVGSPTYTVDFSKCLIGLVNSGEYGDYNMGGKGKCTRYDMANKIVTYLGYTDVRVTPVDSSVFPLPAPRPDSESLENARLEALGINIMRPWEKAMEEYIDECRAQIDVS